jgi:hypothetical protein
LWASGTSTTLNKEYVLDIKRWRWFEIDRTSGCRLQLGIEVADTYGTQTAYGFDNAGYMLRLENGTTFNTIDITSQMKVGYQIPIQSDIMSETEILRSELITVAKNTDSAITLVHTIDGSTGGGTSYALSAADATHDFAIIMQDLGSTQGIFHTFDFTQVSDDEVKGFEPLFFAMYYEKIRDHKH